MSCFRLPESIGADINRLCAGFWWGDEEDHKKMHWAKWVDLCRPKERGGMGFRDIRSFNRAMLAKQIWRIINNPSSLVAKVFRARYFRKGDIMNATVGNSASYIWRSLAWSRPLIKRGLLWKVGDGQKINAFRDAWIPNLAHGALTLNGAEGLDVKVAELINPNGQWDPGILNQMCRLYEQEAIRDIRVGMRNMEDSRYWKFEENGKYSVKSGYLAEIGFYDPPTHTHAHECKFWNSTIWSLKVPPKVRIFLWRVFKGFLPVETNLLKHHVPTKGICMQCGKQMATSEHCLIFCEIICSTWKESRFWQALKQCKLLDFAAIGEFMHHKLAKKDFEIWVILLWMVWHYVCKLKHDKGLKHETVSEEQGVIFWQAHQEAKAAVANGTSLGVLLGNRKWLKPESGTYRVDVDAMCNPSRNQYGVGVIIRDPEGGIIAAMSRPLEATETSVRAEILAVIHGLIFCLKEQIRPISIFTDSVLTIRALTGMEDDCELLPRDLQEMLPAPQEGFLLGIYHAYRSATLVAHQLAQFAQHIQQQMVWKYEFPDWIVNAVVVDNIDI